MNDCKPSVYHAIFFTDMSSKIWHMKPLGAYRLASELRDHGYNVLVIDFFSKWLEDLPNFIRLLKNCISDETLFVGYSSTFYSKIEPGTKEIKTFKDYFGTKLNDWPIPVDKIKLFNDLLKKQGKNLKIFYGGANSSTISHAIENSGVDYVVQGFADSFIVDLLDRLKNRQFIKYNLTKSKNVKIIDYDIKGENFNFPESITRFHESDFITKQEVLPIETSRGCLFKCKFCAFPLLGRKKGDPDYHRHTSVIAEELRYNYQNFGVTRYTMLDDTFNETTEKLNFINDAIKESGVKIEFSCYLRLDLIERYPEQITILRDMGLRSCFLGIETLHEKAAKSIGKSSHPERIKNILKEMKKEWGDDVSIFGSFISGLPYENKETISNWMDWVYNHPDLIDSYVINGLNLTRNHLFPSEIGRDPEKFGYKIIGKSDSENKNLWANNVGFSLNDAVTLSEEIMEKAWNSGRLKIAGWDMLGMLNMGYSYNELKHYSLNNLPFENFSIRYKEMFRDYQNKLIQYTNK